MRKTRSSRTRSYPATAQRAPSSVITGSTGTTYRKNFTSNIGTTPASSTTTHDSSSSSPRCARRNAATTVAASPPHARTPSGSPSAHNAVCRSSYSPVRGVPTYCTVYATLPAVRATSTSQPRSPTYFIQSSTAYGWSTTNASAAIASASSPRGTTSSATSRISGSSRQWRTSSHKYVTATGARIGRLLPRNANVTPITRPSAAWSRQRPRSATFSIHQNAASASRMTNDSGL